MMLAKVGKRTKEWLKLRKEFLKDKVNHQGYYVCENCGNWTRRPHVDHIKPRGSHPELVFEISNLQVLCQPCHFRKHGQL